MHSFAQIWTATSPLSERREREDQPLNNFSLFSDYSLPFVSQQSGCIDTAERRHKSPGLRQPVQRLGALSDGRDPPLRRQDAEQDLTLGIAGHQAMPSMLAK